MQGINPMHDCSGGQGQNRKCQKQYLTTKEIATSFQIYILGSIELMISIWHCTYLIYKILHSGHAGHICNIVLNPK